MKKKESSTSSILEPTTSTMTKEQEISTSAKEQEKNSEPTGTMKTTKK